MPVFTQLSAAWLLATNGWFEVVMAQRQLKALPAQNITRVLQRRLPQCVCVCVPVFMRDSMCPCVSKSVRCILPASANLCVCSSENGAIHRIMGRQLFENEGLYLHKRPWKEKNTERKS